MFLTSSSQRLEVRLGESEVTLLEWTVAYLGSSVGSYNTANGTSSGTTAVTLFSGPSSGSLRLMRFTMKNKDGSTPHHITVRKYDGSATFDEVTFLVQPGESLIYNRLKGWYVFQGTYQVPAGYVDAGPSTPGVTGAPSYRRLEIMDTPAIPPQTIWGFHP
jgi:hypothetical protein